MPVLVYFILWTLAMALKLSFLRWAEMVFFWPHGAGWRDAFYTVVQGFRFDLMIVGFWLAPVVVYMIFSKLISGRAFVRPLWTKIYLVGSWLFICLLYWKDLVSYSSGHGRLWLDDHRLHPLLNFDQVAQVEWWAWIPLIFLILGLIRVGMWRFDGLIGRLQNVGTLTVVAVFFWTVLLCRGSVGHHHLRRMDCQFSENPKVESLCLNPVFTFSKHRED